MTSRFHKASRLIAALALLVSALAFASPQPASAVQGLCDAGGNVTNIIYVKKEIGAPGLSGTAFDYVSGQVTLRDLDICTKIATNLYGGSWILGANVESNSGDIYQIGYGQNAGDSTETIWLQVGGGTAPFSVGRPFTMNYGDTLKFEVWKANDSGSTVGFRATDTTNGQSYTTFKNTGVSWDLDSDRAWWGAETHDNSTTMGTCSTCARVALRFLGYSTNANGTIYYRSGMTSGDVYKIDPNSNHHGHIVDWTYGADALEVESH